jgi:excisionase family DNA binding protein
MYEIDEDPKPLWVDLHGAIRISGIKRTTLYHLINDGRLKSIKVGKRRLFSVRSIEELEGDPIAASAPSRCSESRRRSSDAAGGASRHAAADLGRQQQEKDDE